MNFVDIIILLILIVFVAIGFYKGFVFSILSLFSGFLNFVLAILLTKPVNNVMNSIFKLEGSLTTAFANKFTSLSSGFNTNLVGMTDEAIKSHVSSTLSDANFPMQKLFNRLLNIKSEIIADKTSLSLNDILSKSFGSFFSLIISFVVIFILIYIVLLIISAITKKARKIDGIRVADRIFGVLFGVVKAALVICFIFSILSFFNENGMLKPVFEYINASPLGKLFYGPINDLVDKYLNFNTLKNALSGSKFI